MQTEEAVIGTTLVQEGLSLQDIHIKWRQQVSTSDAHDGSGT